MAFGLDVEAITEHAATTVASLLPVVQLPVSVMLAAVVAGVLLGWLRRVPSRL